MRLSLRSPAAIPHLRLAALLLVVSLVGNIACVKRSRSRSPADAAQANKPQPATTSTASPGAAISRININTASARELEALPGIGEGLAARIVEHRQKYGAFRRPEHLIIVRGISDRRFRALRNYISVE